ncbi:MAG: hypothetical protein A2V50_03395 [Bacteroidetes bacterium RBG_19FT_COMBO_42_10]|nr:MAG: hypothetical protein A2V50_03395 [Bacteroidetes bacterium RBG_19FT_COMBO_42_10]
MFRFFSRQDLGNKKWWGPRQAGVTTFYNKMVDSLLRGNDFVLTTFLRAFAGGAKQYTFVTLKRTREKERREAIMLTKKLLLTFLSKNGSL